MTLQLRIAGGRTIRLDSFHLQTTPSGTQGGEETIEDAIRRLLPDSEVMIVGRSTPQPYLCVGTFHSEPIDDCDATCSVAAIAWFTSDPSAPIVRIVERGLISIDWEAIAENSYV